MKELFDSFDRVQLNEKKGLVLLDTCFIFSVLDQDQELPKGLPYALSSFTVEEILKVGHRLHKMKVRLRRLLKENDFIIIETPVHIGDYKGEKEFVSSIDLELLKHIQDPSDAVLFAVAIKTHSTLFTKDKHHLFTAELENYGKQFGLQVYKELKDLNNENLQAS